MNEPPGPPVRKAGSNPKLHHVVAKFYLERFAVAGKVDLVRRDDLQGDPITPSIEKALAENYFYSVDTDAGREPLGEEFLRDHVDGPGSAAIRRIFDEGRSPAEPRGPRATISMFLAFQFLRGNRVREALVEQRRADGQVLAAMATPSEVQRIGWLRGEEISGEEAADTAAFANSGDFKIEVPHPANVHIADAFPHVFGVIRFFHARTWRMVEFKEPSLITSDEPVALVGPDRRSLGHGGGLANSTEIVFPVDPRRALIMVRPDIEAEEGRFVGRPEEAEFINRHVAYGAHRFIVRTPGTNPLANVVLPTKAPSVFVVKVDNGFVIGSSTNASEEHRARMIKRVQRKYGSGNSDEGRPKRRRP